MNLYVSVKTNAQDLYIDYIEATLKNGKTVSLNWDESNISRSEDGFEARYKGVYFGEEYANGKISELEDLKVTEVGLYSESTEKPCFVLESMTFKDEDRDLHFEGVLYAENNDIVFIFDDELYGCQDEKAESVDGYLWATDVLVERMKNEIDGKHPPEVMESLDNINFYAYYNAKTASIEVNGTYYYYDGDVEKQGEFDLPLSQTEKNALVSALEDYCQKHYSQNCLDFVNEGRKSDGLPPIQAVSSLNNKIQAAQERMGNPEVKEKIQNDRLL